MIEIILNGETVVLPQAASVAAALTAWGYRSERIAVARNGEFVARSDYATIILNAHDCIDVVAPMQGG